jgi:phosphatidate cytidylyltransferase
MKTRAVTSFFFVITILFSVFMGEYVFSAFYLLLCVVCLREFYRMFRKSGIKPNMQIGIINCVVLFVLLGLVAYQNTLFYHKLVFLLTLTVSSLFIRELFRRSETPFNNIALTIGGLVYICLPFTFFHALAFIKGGFNNHFPIAFMLLLWGNDTGAYLFGMKFGRTSLFERHSPKKTWEGFIGGVLTSCAVAVILSFFYLELPWYHWIAVSFLICCFGTLGDLIESMFKRSIHVKDSGEILPGHGGLLDRFDGLLLAAPVVYTYLFIVMG